MKMNTKHLIIVAGTILVLNGCVSTQKYTRPVMPVPSAFPTGEAYQNNKSLQNTLLVKDITWQNVFPDQKLQKVIELGLTNNRDLRLAILNVEQARALYGIQEAQLYPSFAASATGTRQRTPADIASSSSAINVKQYSVNLGITAWEIDLFGRIRSLKKQALQQYLATEQVQHATQTALISEIASVYLSLAADQENLKLARATLETQQGVHDIIQQQFDQGLANKADLLRAQTQIDTAKADIVRYTELVAQDRNALNLLAGASVPDNLLPADWVSISAVKDIAPGLSSEVLLRRPDIMAAEYQLKAANAYIDVARAAFFPQISLTTLIGTASTELLHLFNSAQNTWTFAPQVNMPIFDPRIGSAYKLSKAQREIYLVQYEKTIQTAFREVADALAVRGTVDQQLAVQESIVKSAQEIYAISNQRYTNGIDSYLSVLDAQRSLYSAQQQLTSLRLAKLANQAKLYAVLGGDGASQDNSIKK
ncbi:MAG: efflux transporter outer membrane subunit [bacterium]